MNWTQLYDKIGKQSLSKMRKSKVVVIIEGEEIPVLLKFNQQGLPYLITKEEYNYQHCEKCAYYNIGDGYEDRDICRSKKCKYYND